VPQSDQALVEKKLSDFEADSLVHGYVKHTDSHGCFVWLTRDIVGRVLIKDVSPTRALLHTEGEGRLMSSFRPAEHGLAVLTTITMQQSLL
jgi:hypothetical protein